MGIEHQLIANKKPMSKNRPSVCLFQALSWRFQDTHQQNVLLLTFDQVNKTCNVKKANDSVAVGVALDLELAVDQ